jgi:hypothetical protein
MIYFCAFMLVLIWFELSTMRHGWRWIKRLKRKPPTKEFV